MNPKIWKQYDARWASKPYPRGSTFGGCGCGCAACTHIAMEQESKQDWTFENLRQWMIDQGFALRGQGTTWEGIRQTLHHIGHEKVVWITESMPMKDAFAELDKGNRIGIILFYGGYSKRKRIWYRSPDGTVWTASGHFIAFTDYKVDKDGRHWFFLKDSGGRDHDGWYCFEKSMKGTVGQLWIVERIGKQSEGKEEKKTDGKLAVDGIGGVATVKKLQSYLGVAQTGGITIKKSLHKYCPSLKAVEYGKSKSATVKALQKWLGITADGYWGADTSKALQKKLNVNQDGIFGEKSMKALQSFLNGDTPKKEEPKKEEPKKEEPKKEEKVNAEVNIPSNNASNNASEIVAKAKALCWPLGTPEKKWKYKTGAPTTAYANATKGEKKITRSDCGFFVKVVLKNTPVGAFNPLNDKKIPSTLKLVHNGGKIKDGELKAGDIVAYKKKSGQHTLIYMGDGIIAEAGREVRFSVLRKSTNYNGDDVKHSTIKVYRAK